VALIEKFIPDNFMFSYNGYYLITLKACATYFSELKQEILDENPELKKSVIYCKSINE